MKCPDGLLPDGDVCSKCGGERGASGVDGGSWVHFDSKKSDRVVCTEYSYGVVVKITLANGVVIRPKPQKLQRKS